MATNWFDPSTYTSGDWGNIVNTGAGLFSAYNASNAASDAANTLANATNAATQAAQFKPYNIVSGFGASAFDPTKQQATYTLSPQMEAFRNKYYSMAANALGAADVSPEAAAQNWMAQQSALLQPGRSQEDIALRNQMLGSGRIGLGLSSQAVGAGNAGGMMSPEQWNLNQARAMADAQMAANAQQYGQQQINQNIANASSLFGTGTGIEQLGQSALTMGADIGKTGVAAGQNVANALLSGAGQQATANLYGSNAQNAALQNATKAFGGLFTGGR